MSARIAALAASVVLAPTFAHAQPVSGLYVGGGIGWNWVQDSDLDLRDNLATALTALPGGSRSGSIETEDGIVGVLSLGWGFGNGVRTELEASYRENSIDSISGFVPGGLREIGGTWRSWGAMVNVLYDFDLSALGLGRSTIQPYIGAGIGWQRVQLDGGRARTAAGVNLLFDDESDVFAYQAILGAAFPISSVPGLAITAEYRFLGTTEPDIDVRVTGPAGTVRGGSDVNYRNHSIMLGVRYAFDAAPPPPPAVPPAPAPATAATPAPARTYLVFFDFNRAELNDRARQIIAEAASNVGRVQTTRIEVGGHADRSGTPQYNERLSRRRADAVTAELERRGVSRSDISVQAFGNRRPGPTVRVVLPVSRLAFSGAH